MSLLLTFGKKSVIQRALSVLRKFGTNAHAYIPGGSSTYGPELVVNGGFDTDTNWIKVAGWTIGTGLLNATAGAFTTALQSYALTPLSTYQVTYTVSNFSAGTCRPTMTGGVQVTGTYVAANGVFTERLVATSGSAAFGLQAGGSGFTGSIDNISVKEVLTTTSVVLNGLTAGNYTDTAGTQFTTKDQFVGLGLDAMGSLGAELIPPGNWVSGSFAVITSQSDNGFTVDASAGDNFAAAYKTVTGLIVGNTYKVTALCNAVVTGTAIFRIGPDVGSATGSLVATLVGTGTVTVSTFFTASATSLQVGVALGLALTKIAASGISVKEVTGIHATQGTAGNKPVLRQGPVNLLLNSATLSTQSVAVAASPHTLSFTGTGTVTKSGTATGALVGTGATDRVTQTFTPTAGTLTLTVTGSVTSAQLQLGLAATTYIPTTSAKASAGTGPSYWEFGGDGTPTDYLGLGSVPFQMSDDHWVVVASSCTASGAINTIVDLAGSATGQRCAALYYNSSRNLVAVWTDDTAVARTITHGSSLGDSVNVATAIKIGNNKRLRVNGVQSGSVETSVMGTTTISLAAIGRANWSSLYLNGNIYAVLCGKGTITDADLLLIEKLAANLAGVTLA